MSGARLLPATVSQRLDAQEADPYHIPAARQALEEALVLQLRAVARGLFADQLLRGEVPDDGEWWYQYASQREPLAAPPPDEFAAGLQRLGEMGFQSLPTTPWEEAQGLFQTVRASLNCLSAKRAAEAERDDPAFQAFRKSFPLDTALRRVRRIAPSEAQEIRIRIYGGDVNLWQEGRINRQLQDLGSPVRYCFEGARENRMIRTRRIVGLAATGGTGPPSFVLGEAGPVGAVGRASLVEFEREFAVSPYTGSAPGYSEGMKAVVRRAVPLRFPIDPGDHELFHALTDPDHASGLVSWHAVLRDDICRYCQTPRRLENIAYEFSRAFGFDMARVAAVSHLPLGGGAMSGNGYPAGETPEELPLHRIIERLSEEELLIVKEMNYYCPLFEESRRWHLA